MRSTGPLGGHWLVGFERGQSAVAGGGEATERSGGGPVCKRRFTLRVIKALPPQAEERRSRERRQSARPLKGGKRFNQNKGSLRRREGGTGRLFPVPTDQRSNLPALQYPPER